jgi:hypothetical protein
VTTLEAQTSPVTATALAALEGGHTRVATRGARPSRTSGSRTTAMPGAASLPRRGTPPLRATRRQGIGAASLAAMPIHNATEYRLPARMTAAIRREAQEHCGDEGQAIQVQAGLARHACHRMCAPDASPVRPCSMVMEDTDLVETLGASSLSAACAVCGDVAIPCAWCCHAMCDACLLKQGNCSVCETFCIKCLRRLLGVKRGRSRPLDATNDYEGTM